MHQSNQLAAASDKDAQLSPPIPSEDILAQAA